MEFQIFVFVFIWGFYWLFVLLLLLIGLFFCCFFVVVFFFVFFLGGVVVVVVVFWGGVWGFLLVFSSTQYIAINAYLGGETHNYDNNLSTAH